MPIQLRVLAVTLSIVFLVYVVQLIKKDKAEIRHMLKWLILAFIILFGALFAELGSDIAHMLGITTLTSLSLFILVSLLLLISLKYQMSLISAEKQIKNLVQEVSLLKKEINEIEKK